VAERHVLWRCLSCGQRIGLVKMAGAGEPAQRPSAHRRVRHREISQCPRARLGEAQLPVFAGGKCPVDHTAMKVALARYLHEAERVSLLHSRLLWKLHRPRCSRSIMAGTRSDMDNMTSIRLCCVADLARRGRMMQECFMLLENAPLDGHLWLPLRGVQ
jgi:hypothetical protein